MSSDREAPETPEPPAAAVQVDHAENVNVPPSGELPHARIIMTVSFLILGAFAIVTFVVLSGLGGAGIDAATKGSIIQTWNNLAVAAATFWVGSSLAGKMSSGGRGQ